jgi:hypothetical protein
MKILPFLILFFSQTVFCQFAYPWIRSYEPDNPDTNYVEFNNGLLIINQNFGTPELYPSAQGVHYYRNLDPASHVSHGLDVAKGERYPYWYIWRGAGYSNPPVTGDIMSNTSRRSDGSISWQFGSVVGGDTAWDASYTIRTANHSRGLYLAPQEGLSTVMNGAGIEVESRGNGISGYALKSKHLGTDFFTPIIIADDDGNQWYLTQNYSAPAKHLGIMSAGTSAVLQRWQKDSVVSFPLKVQIPFGTISASSEQGAPGQLKMDATYLYGCTSADTWKRIPWATF